MRIVINGFGRIGRAAFEIILKTPALELVAVNDLSSPSTIRCSSSRCTRLSYRPQTVSYFSLQQVGQGCQRFPPSLAICRVILQLYKPHYI